MAEKNYAIFTAEKLNRNKMQEIKKRCDHVNRVDFAENVNKELSHLNRCVMGVEGSDWFQLFKERCKELDYYKQPNVAKLRKDAVVGIVALATMSHNMGDKIDIDAWVDATNKWMQEHFGKENVVHGVLHLDEKTLHIHYFITPVKDGRFMAYEIMGNRNDYRERQTEYAKAMEPLGLTRGLKRGYRAEHYEMTQMYATRENIMDLPNVFEQETAEEYRKRTNGDYRGLQARNKYLEFEIENYQITQDYATDLERKYENLEKEHEKLSKKNNKLEHNFIYRRLGDYLVEDLIYAAESYPDKDVVVDYL
ncbi:MAG: MobV family relaxase [Suipraeoptans sp.]